MVSYCCSKSVEREPGKPIPVHGAMSSVAGAYASAGDSETQERCFAFIGRLDAGLQQLAVKLDKYVLPRVESFTDQQDQFAKLFHVTELLERVLQKVNGSQPLEPMSGKPVSKEVLSSSYLTSDSQPSEPISTKSATNGVLSNTYLSSEALTSSMQSSEATSKNESGPLAKQGVTFSDDSKQPDSVEIILRSAASSDVAIPEVMPPSAQHALKRQWSALPEDRGMKTVTSNIFAENAHVHWRRMIRREITHMQLPLTRASIKDQEKALARNPLQRFFHSFLYETLSAVLVLLNAVFIGLQVEHFAEYRAVAKWQYGGEVAFCTIFTLELVLRLASDRNSLFRREKGWNLFDTIVVLLMLTEQALAGLSPSTSLRSQISVLRVLRLMRVLRLLKIIRIITFFRELRMMVNSILACFTSLAWAMLVQGVMFYIFGISLTQGVLDYCEPYEIWGSPEGKHMRKYFGTLGRSTLSLFEAMAGGISWGELVDAIVPLHDAYKCIFILYICLAIFAVANIVTAVFVESAVTNAQRDREAIIQEQMESNRVYLQNMQKIFHELDRDGDGNIAIHELRCAVKDERVVACLNAFGLDITDAHTLFVLLDRDQSGLIDTDEFLLGCLRLKGEAKNLDVAKIQYECEWLIHNVETIIAGMKNLGAFMETQGFHPKTDAPLPSETRSIASLLNSESSGIPWN